MKKQNNYWTDKAAGKIVQRLIETQSKMSGLVNEQLNKTSRKKLKLGLISFCLLSGSFSVWLLVQSFHPNTKATTIRKIQPIRQPQLLSPVDTVDPQLYHKIQLYKQYMDSLQESIRPGLFDSIRIIEEIYQSQKP